MPTSDRFTARIQQAAREGYTGAGRAARKADRLPEPRFTDEIRPRQLEYVTDLLQERNISAESRPAYAARLRVLAANPAAVADLTRVQASALIDCLSALPRRVDSVPVPRPESVPAGRYAVQPEEGQLRFYKVDRPTEGRWAGYTFVERQESGDFRRISRGEQAQALRLIEAQGVKESAARYGHELGVCGVCARELTNEESRAAGIGPVCRAKNGW